MWCLNMPWSAFIFYIGNTQPIKVHKQPLKYLAYFTHKKAETMGLYNLLRSYCKSAVNQPCFSDLPAHNTSSLGEVKDMFSLQLFHCRELLGPP